MTVVATRKRDIDALKALLKCRKQISVLEEQIAELKKQADAATETLRGRHPEGIALELKRGKAAIVEFKTFERQYVNMDAVKKLLKNKLPMRTTEVSVTRISEGVIE